MHEQRTPTPSPTPPTAGLQAASHEHFAADALHYWERRRIAYNAVLVLVVGAVFLTHWTQLLARASLDLALGLFLLAVLANVAYCAAYPVDLFVQRSGLADARRRVRPAVFVVGTLFASVLAQFVARGIITGG